MNNKSALGILFRIPEYGKVKKRLAAQIGTEDALSVYAAMLYETIESVSKLTDIDIYGFYQGLASTQHSLLKKFQSMPQKGKDLGERMLNAVQWLFEKGYNKVVLIGADSPDLPARYIEDAFLKLNYYELVIGPAVDGGYYLIGMNMPLGIIFKGIKWGSNSVLKDTISIANNEGIRYFLLPQWYDIDDIESLRQWKNQQFSNSFLP
ncbi:TIGR04282 family arsenosugar biosynthesis glycosyltransferase [Dissulfurispira sp.]|uniref:TIGR04282 family arsenosugar biosynthesis glycosyltransferase n=1 Tax=Dissulfurispira sp. TaxID=2817609 RepID=UPI002FD9E23E